MTLSKRNINFLESKIALNEKMIQAKLAKRDPLKIQNEQPNERQSEAGRFKVIEQRVRGSQEEGECF